MAEKRTDERRSPRAWLSGSFNLPITITFTVAISVATSIAIENRFFEADSGWNLVESSTTTAFAVEINEDLTVSELEVEVEVEGDILISGSELQIVASGCSDLAAGGEAYLCFDGDSFVVSENGAPYAALRGGVGAVGPQGRQGERGPEGPPGPSTPRLWLFDRVAFDDARSRSLDVLGAGFEAATAVELILVSPSGRALELGGDLVSTGQNGAFVARTSFKSFDFEPGVYVLVAQSRDGAVLAVHPVCGNCAFID